MADSKALIIERTFDAPIEKVWEYFSGPEKYKKWWGPKNFTAPFVEMDFHEGGKFLGAMRGSPAPGEPEQDFWSTGTYKEIVEMERIVATDSFADEKGNIVPSSNYGMEGFPLEAQVMYEFEGTDGKTKLKVTHSGIENVPEKDREAMEQGWNESLDKIEEDLKLTSS